ncbi:unnamed protein product [Cutaneotrichosporon oleaginosum]
MDYSQYAGPFEVISKLQVRYTGIFQEIDQETQTLCLSDVYNHGTEDRPSERSLPGSSESLGWVRFHTNSINKLSLLDNPAPPVSNNAPVDPALASVSGPRGNSQTSPAPRGVAGLPPKPYTSAHSAETALGRVQQSLTELSTDPGRQRRKPQAPAVPDAEFDFSKGNEKFQKERQARKAQEDHEEEVKAEVEAVDLGAPQNVPHPSAVVSSSDAARDRNGKPHPRKGPSYNKSSFFDNISSDSSRVSRAEERHRNLDTFGEAGGDITQGYRLGQQSGRGGMQGRGRGRGGGGGGGNRRGGYNNTPAWAA